MFAAYFFMGGHGRSLQVKLAFLLVKKAFSGVKMGVALQKYFFPPNPPPRA